MPEQLKKRIGAIRRRVRLVVWLYGLSWVITVLFLATLCIGTLDWWIHFDDGGVRLIFGLSTLAAAGWVGFRFLIHPLKHRLSDVDIALRIEDRYPGFQDSLASTVEFSAANADPRIGSPELQQQVIAETMERIDEVDIADVVQTKPIRDIVTAAIAVCVLVAFVVGVNRSQAAIAVNRLLFPFSDLEWPRSTRLQLLDEKLRVLEFDPTDPLRIARGDTLELYVENAAGSLPKLLSMQYRFADGNVVTETIQRASLRDDQGQARDVGKSSLLVVKGPTAFRAVGGDDDSMPWYPLRVVPPPVLENIRVTLTEPTYARGETTRLPKGIGHVEGLVGSQVKIKAVANKALRFSKLRIRNTKSLALELSADGRNFEATFEITEAGVYSYWFELRDRQGFENPDARRYEIRGIADAPPEVHIDNPPTDLSVTVDAEVPVQIVARDDLGLNSVRLRYGFDSAESAKVVPLHAGQERPLELTLDHVWKLSEMSLSPGMRLTFFAEAADDCDIGTDHVRRSNSRTLTIVTAEEKRTELASRQVELQRELERIAEQQRRAHEQVGELKLQRETTNALRPEDLDLLKRLELDQRQISSRLVNPVDGVETRAGELLRDAANNRIEDPAAGERLERIIDELSYLREEQLPVIERELTRARKDESSAATSNTEESKPASNDTNPPPSETPAEALSLAQDAQAEVLRSLGGLESMLGKWRSRRELDAELGDLIAGQKEIVRRTESVQPQTLGKSKDELSPQLQADLARIADRQRRSSERLGQFRARLSETADRLAESDPALADAAAETASRIEEDSLESRMREAAADLDGRNLGGKLRVGKAHSAQSDLVRRLDELQKTLRDEQTTNSEVLVKKLREAEEQLETLQKKQEQLAESLRKAQSEPDPALRLQKLERLKKQQQELAAETSRVARLLKRLQAKDADQALRRAAESMRNAARDIEGDAPPDAARQQQESLDDLEQARRDLAQRRREVEEQLARELLERMADDLLAMIAKQQNVIDETLRLEAARIKRGSRSRGQLKTLRDLATNQRDLLTETAHLAEAAQAAEVFALALSGAVRHMQAAADRLDKRLTDTVTVTSEQNAKKRFEDLIAALKASSGDQAQPPNGGDGGEQSAGPETDGIPQLAQLKMLKTLQQDVLERTAELEGLRKAGTALSAEQLREVDSLADEQGRLADLARNLARQVLEAFRPESEEETPKNDK